MKFRAIIASCVVALLVEFSGCSRPTQISSANRKLLQALQTAASAKKKEWLDEVEKNVEEKRQKKELSNEEYNALTPIIKKAKAGNWKQANLDAIALCEGQTPTAQELEKFNSRKSAK